MGHGDLGALNYVSVAFRTIVHRDALLSSISVPYVVIDLVAPFVICGHSHIMSRLRILTAVFCSCQGKGLWP